jgi:hypothetical protein
MRNGKMTDEVTYLEFDDEDDPKSRAYKTEEERTSIRITVLPQMYLLAMVEDPKVLAGDVLEAVETLMYAAYEQGKRVGREM